MSEKSKKLMNLLKRTKVYQFILSKVKNKFDLITLFLILVVNLVTLFYQNFSKFKIYVDNTYKFLIIFIKFNLENLSSFGKYFRDLMYNNNIRSINKFPPFFKSKIGLLL